MKASQPRRSDWPSIVLLILMLQVATARLVVTHWTDFLIFAQTLAALGSILGLALGHSQFTKRAVRWLVFGYSVILIPWQLSLVIDPDVLLSERLASVGGRLLFSLEVFFRREPVEDSLLFVAFISTLAWFLSIASGYWWARHNNYLMATLPGGIFALTIQGYDQIPGSRNWLLGFYFLLALLLLGRFFFLQNREQWQERQVFLMQESAFDISRGMVITAVLFVFIAWSIPASQAGLDSARRTWTRLTKPWRDMQEWFSNAVEPLESQAPPKSGDFFTSRLNLGTGNPLSETVLFSIQAPELLEQQARFYWRGYVYDLYQNNIWSNTEAELEKFSPSDDQLDIPDSGTRSVVTLTVTTQIRQFLLYTATQPLWISRPANIRFATAGAGEQDLFAWLADTQLAPGEQYQFRASVADPSIQELQAAGTEYPQWVTEKYLQLPENFSPRIRELASEITADLETPYDKAAAVTSYLRREIEYVNPLPQPLPEGEDPLEWVLFDLKQGFCNYYASAEVLMLRSLGVPARMAVGFAEGQFDPETFVYTVRSLDAHAWPEVFFPGIGWIEFEPTGNQAPLVRPDRPIENINPALAPTPPIILEPPVEGPSNNGPGFDERNNLNPLDEPRPVHPLVYLVSVVFLIYLLWLLNRQYAVIDQIPIRLQRVYERNGGQAPVWLNNWARWNLLSPIERSFETINRCLRLLGETPAMYHTPSERAEALIKKLPKATSAIDTLTEQHLNSLFSPRSGDVGIAVRSSLRIWLYTIQSIFRKFIGGADE